MSDLTRGLKAVDDALPGYELAERMYKGTNLERLGLQDEQLEAKLRANMEHYRLNLAAKTVNSRLARLAVNALKVADKEGSDSAEQRAVEQVSQDNELDLELPEALAKMARYGDSYLYMWPPLDEEITDGGVAAKVEVFVRSPKGMRAMYDVENSRRIEYVIDTWCDEDGYLRVNLLYADRIERYISTTKRAEHSNQVGYSDSMFEEYAPEPGEGEDAEESVIPNPWGRIPVAHLRTERPYGVPVHWNAYGSQNLLTSMVANQQGAITGYAFPFRYALSKTGTTGADLNDWPTSAEQAPDNRRFASAEHGNGQRSKLDARPGTLTKLHNTDAVGQLESAAASNFTDPIDQHIRIFSSLTDTPMDISSTGAPESGESRRAKLDGLIAQVESLQRSAGSAIANAMEIALAMLGMPDTRIVVEWKPTEKISDKDGWDAVASKEAAGVPAREALIEAGYLPEQVDAWENSLEGRLDLFARIAATATGLGQAAQLAGVDMTVVTEAVSALIVEALGDGAGTD